MNEKLSLAAIIQRDFGDTAPAATTEPVVESAPDVSNIDSARVSKFFETTAVRRAREFEGREPATPQAAQVQEVDPPSRAERLAAQRAALEGLSGAELEIRKEALIDAQVAQATEPAEEDYGTGEPIPSYEEYVTLNEEIGNESSEQEYVEWYGNQTDIAV